MQKSNKFVYDIGITLIASIINMFLGFIITVLLGRYFGAAELGLYRLTFSIYGLVMLFAANGIPAVIIKYVAENKDNMNKINEIVSSGIITSLFVGIGTGVLFYFSSDIFEASFNISGLSELLKILSLIFPFALLIGVLLGLLNALREMKKYAIAIIIQNVILFVFTILFIVYGFGVKGAVIGLVLSSVVCCLFLIWVSKKYFIIIFSNYFLTTRQILKFGWKIVAINGINQINYQADTFLIALFLTAKDIGYYGVAVNFSKLFWLIPQAVQTISYPVTSEYWTNNNHLALQTMMEKCMKYTACILLPIGLELSFFGKEIVTLLFGKNFIDSVLPLQILIFGAVVYGIFMSVGSFLTSIGRPDLSLKINSISAIINIVFNISLIPIFGIVGAALSTTASFIVLLGLSLYQIKIVGNITINLKPYIQLFIITIFLVILMLINWMNVYIMGILIIILYITAIFAFVLTKEDKRFVKYLIKFTILQQSD